MMNSKRNQTIAIQRLLSIGVVNLITAETLELSLIHISEPTRH